MMKQMRHPQVLSEMEEAALNPFAESEAGDSSGAAASGWAISQAEKTKFDNLFHSCALSGGKLQGSSAKEAFSSTGLPNSMLFKVWKAADVDGDGALDSDEFAVAMRLCEIVKSGGDLPAVLPPNLVPPSKR